MRAPDVKVPCLIWELCAKPGSMHACIMPGGDTFRRLFIFILEIISYGGLPYNLTQSEFYRGVSKPVNARLFEIFVTCGLSEQGRSGGSTVISSYGKKAFSLEDRGRVVVTIPFFLLEDVGNSTSNESKSLSISERITLIPSQRNVLSYLVSHQQALLQDVALECGLSLGEVGKITSRMEKVGAWKG